jgi:hypothetical protein
VLRLACGFEAETEEAALFVVGEAGTADLRVWVETALGSGAESVGIEASSSLNL